LEELSTDGRILLKQVLRKHGEMVSVTSSGRERWRDVVNTV
jgi:hypothetical protein